MEEDIKAVIVTHCVFFNNKDVYGPPHAISHYLNKQKVSHVFVKHPINGKNNSHIEYYRKGKLIKTDKKRISKILPLPLRYLAEFIFNIRLISSFNKIDLFIGIDPLNAVAGIFLKKIKKIKKTIFYCADFSLLRFANSILNSAYILTDKIAMKHSAETWSVSERITAYRKKLGLAKKKNILAVNAPPFEDLKKFRMLDKNKNNLVIVSKLYQGVNFKEIYLALKKLIKKYPKITLHIIGDGEEKNKIMTNAKRMKVDKNVIFYGARSHVFVHKIIAQSYIGFALYKKTNSKDFRYFSDSMKMRDYMACGTPIIITGNTITGLEVKKNNAGFLINLNSKEIFSKINYLLSNPKKYEEMRANALSLAKNRSITITLEEQLAKISESKKPFNIINFIVCPQCRSKKIKKRGERLFCQSCQSSYPIKNNIPILVSPKKQRSIIKDWNKKEKYNKYQFYKTKKIVKILKKLNDKNAISLDAGCGAGAYQPAFMGKVISFDIVPYFVKKANKKFKKPGRYFLVADANEFPFRKDVFDLTFCSQVIEHFPKKESEKLIKNLIIASHKHVLIDTPNDGNILIRTLRKIFYPQGPDIFEEDPLDHHRLIGYKDLAKFKLKVHSCIGYVSRNKYHIGYMWDLYDFFAWKIPSMGGNLIGILNKNKK